jgi:hypothetical protein
MDLGGVINQYRRAARLSQNHRVSTCLEFWQYRPEGSCVVQGIVAAVMIRGNRQV